MKRRLWLLLLLVPAVAGSETPIGIRITRPPADQPVFGVVDVAAVIAASEPLANVTFIVDGRPFAELHKPPFEASTDVGPDNIEHRFSVVAASASGKMAEATLVTPRFESDQEVRVELRQLYVMVKKDGDHLADLSHKDFSIFDEGERQKIITFSGGDIPFTAAILLDSSTSMVGARMEAALKGAKAFVQSMRPLDEGKLVAFGDHIIHSTPFTNVPEVLLAGLGSISARGGTTLNDNLFLALKLLEERQGRRVVVLLSDGVDVHSVLSMNDVLAKVRESQVLIYWVRLHDLPEACQQGFSAVPSLASPWGDPVWYREQRKLLETAVRESGGRILPVCSREEITPAFQSVMRDLREQYAIGYYPSTGRGEGKWHKVRVLVARSGAVVFAREGYFEF